MNRVTLVKVYWEHSDSSGSKARVIDGVIIPYQNEPLADWGKEESSNASGETDIDGLYHLL